MRLTIERLRILVLAAAVLLLGALAVFLAIARWRGSLNRRDIPRRLGINVSQEANGVTYTQARGGRTLFKLHAAKVVQLRKGNALLHDVQIELYGMDGNRVDRIEGAEFEYNQQLGIAKAAGMVEITLLRPGEALAIAPKAAPAAKQVGNPLATVAQTAASGEVHVRTSGLVFDQKSGVATTIKKVNFVMTQGSGSAVGATFDSQHGELVLDHTVELTARRGSLPVELHADHAEFERGDQLCRLRQATAEYNGGRAAAGAATILFRDDGSAQRLNAEGGFTLTTAQGGRLTAPVGILDFDEHNQPRRGHLQNGVTMDSLRTGEASGEEEKLHGSAPAADLDFTRQGQLRHAHMEGGVSMASEERSHGAGGEQWERREWRSPVADVEFQQAGGNRMAPAIIKGAGGVVVKSENRRGNGPISPSRLSADQVTAQLGQRAALSTVIGLGNASMEQTTATGTRQTTRGDRLEVHFASAAGGRAGAKSGLGGGAHIHSAVVQGHVALLEQPAARSGAPPEPPMRATAGKAEYESTGEWLHLSQSPRVDDGELALTANRIDISQVSGDAFAHGDVKATWLAPAKAAGRAGAAAGSVLGGQGPAHVIAAEAHLRQSASDATFRGQARIWQQGNSVSAPVIVLNRAQETLEARSSNPAQPVRAVMMNEAGAEPGKPAAKAGAGPGETPSVIRMRGGELRYSAAERKAVMRGGALGLVEAQTGLATSDSQQVELILLPPGNHAGKNGGAAQVDRMIARGRVAIASRGRRGVGTQLVYSNQTGQYVLTGTAAQPPRLTDPARGTVTGEALIFNSRDDSVSIEGGEQETRTETTAPR